VRRAERDEASDAALAAAGAHVDAGGEPGDAVRHDVDSPAARGAAQRRERCVEPAGGLVDVTGEAHHADRSPPVAAQPAREDAARRRAPDATGDDEDGPLPRPSSRRPGSGRAASPSAVAAHSPTNTASAARARAGHGARSSSSAPQVGG
jgi:hypothetical protein